MRLALFALLTLLTACTASTKATVTPKVADVACDADWTPPEELELSIHERGSAPAAHAKDTLAAEMKANKSATAQKHALHAATY